MTWPRVLPIALVILALASCSYSDIAPIGAYPLIYRDEQFTYTLHPAIDYGPALLDVYSPDNTLTSRPAIIFIHGGSFTGGDRHMTEIVDQAQVFARKGYVTVAIDYALQGQPCPKPIPECVAPELYGLQDGQIAVRWLQAHANELRVDPTRIAAAGSSAGAVTALNLSFNDNVRAAVALSGEQTLGTIDPGDAPVLLFHNDPDGYIPYREALRTVEATEAAGNIANLITWDEPGHIPYAAHRDEILTRTTNFLYWMLDLRTL